MKLEHDVDWYVDKVKKNNTEKIIWRAHRGKKIKAACREGQEVQQGSPDS